MSRYTVLLYTLSLALHAQTGSSSLIGTIADQTGAAIPAAQLRIVNEESGARVETLTNAEGQYRVTSLIPGAYRLEVTKTGFERG